MHLLEFVVIDEHSKISVMGADKDSFSSPVEFLETVLGSGFQRQRGGYPGIDMFVSNQNRESLTPNLIGSFFTGSMPVKGPVLIIAKDGGKLPEILMTAIYTVTEAFIKLRKQGRTVKPVGAEEWLEVQHLTMS